MSKRLDYKLLKNNINLETLDFDSTKDLKPYKDIIGQERALKTLDFSLNIKSLGYNIYICGPVGYGKTTFAKSYIEKKAKEEKVPPDICYIYNFKNPKSPKFLKLESGMSKVFKDDMEHFINMLINELPKAFENKEFEFKKNKIVKSFQDKREEIIKEISEEAKKYNFGVKTTNTGVYFMPIVNEEMISEEEYEDLDEEEKKIILENTNIVQESVSNIMGTIKSYENNTNKEIDDLKYSIGLFTIGYYINQLLDKYKENKNIVEYLIDVKEDILENIDEFIENTMEEDEALQNILPWVNKKATEDIFSKYDVNILVDNSELLHAPVIIENNPTYSNLVGDIEYDSEYGNFTTDFMKIRPGSFHKANGGYLILKAQDVFSNIYAWESLRRVLRTNEVEIEPLKEIIGSIAINSIKPENVPVDVKVILIGSYFYYDIINNFDDEFLKIFKIRVDFDYEMNFTSENVRNIARFIKKFVNENSYMDFTKDSIVKIIEYFMRLAESQDKLTTNFNLITEILEESHTFAKLDNKNIVTDYYVQKAISERKYRLSMYEEKLFEMIEKDIIMIDTKGKKVGQINALSVLDMGDYSFGVPSKVTATTYLGKWEVINIEKESKMSGSIHNKGVSILIGYLGMVYAQEFPLSFSCRICFEQNYNGIEGDSASSTELYAIISSLAEIPINQEFAVTGSINQFGEIQPIGGVNQKIEGFFDICKKVGFTKSQGVIIPKQNVKDLVLKDEVVEAVKNKEFHIYEISHIKEGIEILTGVPYGEKDESGNYPQDSINYKVINKLKKYRDLSLPYFNK